MNKRKNNKIWILEDDIGCQFVYKEILKPEFTIRIFENIKSFKEELANVYEDRPALIIADLTLADGNFLNLDNRVVTKRYGKIFKSIIPTPMIKFSTLDELNVKIKR